MIWTAECLHLTPCSATGPERTFFGQGEGDSSDADFRTYCCKKLKIFLNYGVFARQGGRDSADILWTK